MKRALAAAVLVALWLPVKVLGLLDDIVLAYDPDDLDDWAQQ